MKMHSPIPKNAARFRLAILALHLFFLGHTNAHQPYESGTVARLQHGRLEVTVTMSAEIGARLAASAENPDADSSATFDEFRPRLLKRAAGLLEVFAGAEKLTPQRTIVRLNEHGDAECVLIFPEPKQWPLRMRGQYLRDLPAGYSGAMEVLDAEERGLGARMLTRDGADSELAVNPPPLSPPSAPVVAPATPRGV